MACTAHAPTYWSMVAKKSPGPSSPAAAWMSASPNACTTVQVMKQ